MSSSRRDTRRPQEPQHPHQAPQHRFLYEARRPQHDVTSEIDVKGKGKEQLLYNPGEGSCENTMNNAITQNAHTIESLQGIYSRLMDGERQTIDKAMQKLRTLHQEMQTIHSSIENDKGLVAGARETAAKLGKDLAKLENFSTRIDREIKQLEENHPTGTDDIQKKRALYSQFKKRIEETTKQKNIQETIIVMNQQQETVFWQKQANFNIGRETLARLYNFEE